MLKTMEYLDVVDDRDKVVGKAAYSDIYAQKLPHRIVHLLIFNGAGQMMLQKRSYSKSYLPGYWVTAASGHVSSGETYQQAVVRELKEELGILPTNIELIGNDLFITNSGIKKFLGVYQMIYPGEVSLEEKEVEQIRYIALSAIPDFVRKGEKLHPELVFILKKYYNVM